MLVILESVVHDTSDAEHFEDTTWIFFNSFWSTSISFWPKKIESHFDRPIIRRKIPLFSLFSDLKMSGGTNFPEGSAASQFFGSTESPKGLKLRPTGEGLRDLQHARHGGESVSWKKRPPESSKNRKYGQKLEKKTRKLVNFWLNLWESYFGFTWMGRKKYRRSWWSQLFFWLDKNRTFQIQTLDVTPKKIEKN